MYYYDEWHDNGMDAAFGPAALDRYCSDGMDLFQICSIAEQSQCVASLEANNGSGVRGGERDVSNVAVVKGDEGDWDLDGMKTASEDYGSSL